MAWICWDKCLRQQARMAWTYWDKGLRQQARMAWTHWDKGLRQQARIAWSPWHTASLSGWDTASFKVSNYHNTGDELEGIRKETFAICIKGLTWNLCDQISKHSAVTEVQVSASVPVDGRHITSHSLPVDGRHITSRPLTMPQSTCHKPTDIERILTNPLRT